MIIGAGLAGLIAGHVIPKVPIIDAAPGPRMQHKALLRFRSPDIGNLTGIEFRPVTVRKSIWWNGTGHCGADIRSCNLYARKVIHKICDRSIWNLEPETRWIAPEDFYDRLVESLGDRIKWNCPFDFAAFEGSNDPLISTAPMSVLTGTLQIPTSIVYESSSIHVVRLRIPSCDTFQTVYFPEPQLGVYRASITGDLLTVESTHRPDAIGRELIQVYSAFGLDREEVEFLDEGEQRLGKIAAVDDRERRRIINLLTNSYNIYSLGRFATWRNILQDDVVKDAAIINKLISATQYERTLKQKANKL